MSYKRNSKSRIARLLLALTLMGGVGQKLTNNVSYAVQLNQGKYLGFDFSVIDAKANEGLVQELGVDLDEDELVNKGALTDNAKKFGCFIACNPEYVGEDIPNNGVFQKKSANVAGAIAGVKSSLLDAFNDAFDNYLNNVPLGQGNLRVLYDFGKAPGLKNIDVDIEAKLNADQSMKLILTLIGDVGKCANEASNLSKSLKFLADSVVSPEDESAKSVIVIAEDKLVLKGIDDIDSSDKVLDRVYLSCDLSGVGGFVNDFNKLEISAEKVQMVRSAAGKFLDKEAGNYVLFGDAYYRLTTNLPNKVSMLGTLAAVAAIRDGEDVEAAKEDFAKIAKGLEKVDSKYLDGMYDFCSKSDSTTFPEDRKASSVEFVLMIKKYYEADVEDDKDVVLKSSFNFNEFAGACKKPDDERVEAVLEAAFGLDPFSKFIGFSAGNVASTHLAFLMKALGGNVGVQKTKPKANPGPGSGKSGPGQPGQPGEKKGFSTGAKVAMGITIPAAVLAATGVALWKTGYGAKIWGKIKTLMNKDGNRRPDIKFNSQGKEPIVKN